MRDLMARIGRWVGVTPRLDDLTDDETKTVIRGRVEAQRRRLLLLDAQIDSQRTAQTLRTTTRSRRSY